MQPQNSPPELAPRQAVRLTIGFEQRGQVGGDGNAAADGVGRLLAAASPYFTFS